MKDKEDEIADVMNLILPLQKQLPTGKEFRRIFFDEDGNIMNEDILINAFKGRISYLKSVPANVNKRFMGNEIGTLEHFKVYGTEMSSFQTRKYRDALNIDNPSEMGGGSGGPKGIYNNSRQASLFVFPDGSWGDEGFNRFVNKRALKKVQSYTLRPELRNAIIADTHDEMLSKIKRYSTVYADSIRLILNARESGKNIFIYNEFVQGSGLILFSLILELFGFGRANGREQTGSNEPRYAILTSSTSTSSEITRIVKRFNKDDNMNGDIIQVVLGSRRIAEGLSFNNIQIEDIHTPWFNYANIDQAIARGIRFGSHRIKRSWYE